MTMILQSTVLRQDKMNIHFVKLSSYRILGKILKYKEIFLRILTYPLCNPFILCFQFSNVESPLNFRNIPNHFAPKLSLMFS